MSDSRRKTAGCLMLLVCILLCALPALIGPDSPDFRFRSRGARHRPVQPYAAEKNGPVMMNEAESEMLLILPGVGETVASMIVSEREENGPFYYPEDLESVRGIGQKKLAGIRPMIDMTMHEGRD